MIVKRDVPAAVEGVRNPHRAAVKVWGAVDIAPRSETPFMYAGEPLTIFGRADLMTSIGGACVRAPLPPPDRPSGHPL